MSDTFHIFSEHKKHPVLLYCKPKYLFLMAFFFAAFASLTGIALVSVTLSGVVLYSNVFVTPCPVIEGRVCNNRGTCNEFGLCVCDPQFNGDACEESHCPGYDATTGSVCFNHGVCSPFMQPEHVPAECAQQNPTLDNQYVRKGPGWASESCKLKVQTVWDQIIQFGDYSNANGIPLCACNPPYTGINCQYNSCPQNSDFAVCSGNGNKSVGIVYNNTVTGDGCQCKNYISLLNLVQLLTYDELVKLTTKYLSTFQLGFCGTMIRIGSTLVVKNELHDMVCYCDEKHTGLACEYGVCPEINKLSCGGHGNPHVGFGYKRNTLEYSQGCTPVCSDDTILCNGKCLTSSMCTTTEVACPPNRPWRCPSRECVASTPKCERGYIQGTWDDLSAIPSSISCTITTVNQEYTPLLRLKRRESCFGRNVLVNDPLGFIPQGNPITLSSKLLGIEFYTMHPVNVTHKGVVYTLQGTYPLRFDASMTESAIWDNRFFSTGRTANVIRISDIRLRITPSPLIFYTDATRIRLHGLDGSISGFYLYQTVTVDSVYGTFFIAHSADNLAIRYDGTQINPSLCSQISDQCLWLVATQQSLDGTSYVCLDGSHFIQSTTPCATYTPANITTRISVSMIVETNYTEMYIDSIYSWPYDVYREPESGDLVYLSSESYITEIKYILDQDIRKNCICPPFGTNQSTYNLEWLDEQSIRPTTADVGEYAVGLRQVTDGVLTTTRGRVLSLNPTVVYDKLLSTPVTLIGVSKRITSLEYNTGVSYDDVEIFPIRCVDGTQSTLQWKQVPDVKEECACQITSKNLSCACVNSFNETRLCDSLTCDVNWTPLLSEYCFWSPTLNSPMRNTGFSIVDVGTRMSFDSHSFPLEFTIQEPCSNITTVYPLNATVTCVDDVLSIYPLHSFFPLRQNWTIYTNSTIKVAMYTHYGGFSTIAVFDNYTIEASSNSNWAPRVTSTSRETWKSSETDHTTYLKYTFTKEIGITSAYVDLVNAGIYTAAGTIPVSVKIQGQRGSSWVTLGSITTTVINGSDRHTIPLDVENRLWSSLRLYSFYPMEVRTFIVFTDQNCTHGRLVGDYPTFTGYVQSLIKNNPSTSSLCVCDNTCVIANKSKGLDGVCQDRLFVNPVDPLTTDVCAPGTDCFDCGSNMRNATIDKEAVCYTTELLQMVNSYANQLQYMWTISEFVYIGNVALYFNYTTLGKVAWRWTRPLCANECPLYTCTDGSCANVQSECPVTMYNCPGDGCIRPSITSDKYRCACDKGRGGLRCEFTSCIPGDPETGLVSPHKWCTCNGPSQLRIHPAHEFVVRAGRRAFTDDDVNNVNRPNGRVSNTDVGWVNIRAEKAPYGIPFLRLYTRNGAYFYTNCPYRVRSNRGLFFELEQCVAQRATTWPYEVTEWVTHVDGQRIQWTHETQYDDAPYRCATGHCVASERDCYAMKKRDPMCGHKESICLVDGTCKCPYGVSTFIVTDDLTDKLSVAYAHEGSVMQVVWGEENDNRYVGEWCKARNCSEVDCSPPYGCFPGSKLLDFADREIKCPGPTNEGKCALDVHDCRIGRVTLPLPCSGNGELRRRDYREDEWYCECGNEVDGVFRPNGFGGTSCQDYSCQDDPDQIWYSRQISLTQETYKDINNLPLPGKWIGPCGATVGANPDDIIEWTRCCPGIYQLEMCSKVPCVIGGSTQCIDADVCQGLGYKPKIYVCNGKGKALADGTCTCDYDELTGVGYTYDLAVYSTKGCFKKIQCNAAKTTNYICNKQPACSDFSLWTDFVFTPYYEQQIYMFAILAGYPPTNESIVRQLMGEQLEQVIIQTYIYEALDVLAQIRASETTICVLNANETCDTVVGMHKCTGEIHYMEAIKAPHVINQHAIGLPSLYSDGIFYATTSSISTYGYANLVSLHTRPFTITFPAEYTIDIIRIHIWNATSQVVSFLGDDQIAVICPTTSVTGLNTFKWVDVFCVRTYTQVFLDIVDPDGYTATCKNNEESVFCLEWKKTKCESLPFAVYKVTTTIQILPGCPSSAYCCQTTSDPFPATKNITIVALGYIDEISIYGHGLDPEPLPDGLAAFFLENSGQSKCVDERAFFDPDVGVGGHLSPFRPSTETAMTFTLAASACENHGGAFATLISDPAVMEAEELGRACYDDGTRPAGSTGCFVNARDRNELINPDNLNHLFSASCQPWGCVTFTGFNSPTYFFTPDDGTMWSNSWVGGQRRLTTYLTEERTTGYVTSNGNPIIKWINQHECNVEIDNCNTSPGCGGTPIGCLFDPNSLRRYSIYVRPDSIPVSSPTVNNIYNGGGYDGIFGRNLRSDMSVEPTCIGITSLTSTEWAPAATCGARITYTSGSTQECTSNGGCSLTGGAISSIYVFPQFSTHQVKTTIYNDEARYGPGTDEFTMGYGNQQYMCNSVNIEIVKYYAYGYSNDYLPPSGQETILSYLTPVYVSSPGYNMRLLPGYNSLPDAPGGAFIVPLEHAFVPCSNAGRSIPQCNTCPLTPPTGNYQFYQNVYNEFSFVNSISKLYQSTSNPSGISSYSPKRYVTWTTSVGMTYTRTDFSTFSSTSRAYGRLSVTLRPIHLGTKLEMEHCVAVKRTADGTYPYSFIPVICTDIYYPLCIRDVYKYTVKAGTQCDVCGPSSRNEFTAAGQTAFTLFPRASPENDPLGHSTLEAYLSGQLESMIDQQETIPWNAVLDQMRNISMVFAFPEARRALLDAISTRPNYASPGQQEDYMYWIDMDPSRWFIVDCGLVENPNTGVSQHRCAISKEYCLPANDFEGQPMSLDDIPHVFKSIATNNHTSVLCTKPIHVSLFHIYTNEGGPQPGITELEVLKYDDTMIEFRVVSPNSTWTNIGRRLLVDFSTTFSLAGTIDITDPVGEYRMWIGTQNPTYTTPLVVEYITNWTSLSTTTSTFDVTYTPDNPTMSVWGIEFRHLLTNARLILYTIRYSNTETILVCAALSNIRYVELPSYIVSKAPEHTCDVEVGACVCANNSPFGGPTCEWPTTTTPERGKQECNLYGDDGGYALDDNDDRVKLVSTTGVFFNVDRFSCKCIDPGLIIRTVFRPTSAYDYTYILRRDKKPNADEYIIVDPPADIAVPILYENIKDVCNSESASLPSWNTGDEVDKFVQMDEIAVFVDLEYREDVDQLWWTARGEVFTTETNTTEYFDPCDDTGLCYALNWNNLAFKRTSTAITDGKEALASVTFPVTIPIQTTDKVVVEMFLSGSPSVALTANGNVCTVTSNISGYKSWNCYYDGLTSLVFSGTTASVREVRVFSATDEGRPVGYMVF